MANQQKKAHQQIIETVEQNRRKLAADSYAAKNHYPEKIIQLSELLFKYCQNCPEIDDHQEMLFELARDLPEIANPGPAVKRSIQKRFKVILKHLQGSHGLSLPNQFAEGGIVLGMTFFGFAGIVVMAFNMQLVYPLAGFAVGGILGYYWGRHRDKLARENGTAIEWEST